MVDTAIASPQDRHLTLVVPDLVMAAADDQFGGNLQRLEWLLGRADKFTVKTPISADLCLFQLFGVEVDPEKDAPVAALTRVLDMGVVDNAWWLRADPVHLVPNGDSLMLSAGDSLAVTQKEADQLVREILEVFSGDGWVLKAPRPDRWYLQLIDAPDMRTTPISKVAGQNIYSALPSGKDGKKWHTVLNELQIMLHTSSVNAEREQQGLPAINSLWFWGGGRLPTLTENKWDVFWGKDELGTALARLSQVALADRPASGDNWLREAAAGNHLVVLDQISRAKLDGRAEALQNFIDAFDEQWIEPLIAALRAKELGGLTLVLDGCTRYETGTRSLGRWWRRKVSINALGRS